VIACIKALYFQMFSMFRILVSLASQTTAIKFKTFLVLKQLNELSDRELIQSI